MHFVIGKEVIYFEMLFSIYLHTKMFIFYQKICLYARKKYYFDSFAQLKCFILLQIVGMGEKISCNWLNIFKVEYAVKIIDKVPGHSRARVFKEIDTFHHCQVATLKKMIIYYGKWFEEQETFPIYILLSFMFSL